MRELLAGIDTSWSLDLAKLDKDYLDFLVANKGYFPNKQNIFNAFRALKKDEVKYILLGQDPYPREQSASGYAFIDGGVQSIFDNTTNKLSKEVNRATSLRNFIKMALVARGENVADITHIDKSLLIDSIWELKDNFSKNGVLLLNSALIFTDKKSSKLHSKAWESFITDTLLKLDKNVTLILFGAFAQSLYQNNTSLHHFKYFACEHPYNISFINNQEVIEFFKPFDLLRK